MGPSVDRGFTVALLNSGEQNMVEIFHELVN